MQVLELRVVRMLLWVKVSRRTDVHSVVRNDILKQMTALTIQTLSAPEMNKLSDKKSKAKLLTD